MKTFCFLIVMFVYTAVLVSGTLVVSVSAHSDTSNIKIISRLDIPHKTQQLVTAVDNLARNRFSNLTQASVSADVISSDSLSSSGTAVASANMSGVSQESQISDPVYFRSQSGINRGNALAWPDLVAPLLLGIGNGVNSLSI